MTKDSENDINKILNDDPFDLLRTETKKSSAANTEDQRLINSFEEISNFYEEQSREPEAIGISEFKLYARLKAIRETPAKIKILLPYDFHGLLSSGHIRSLDSTDLIKDDPLGILNNNDIEKSIYKLKNVKKSERIRPDYLARRKKCENFDEYEDLFKCIHDDLESRKRRLIKFRDQNINSQNFYVLNGVVLFLEKVDVEYKVNNFDSGERTRLDGRTHCIFDNGTESSMLMRSLVKALQLDGFGVSEVLDDSKSDIEITPSDESNGFIYILKSKSQKYEISSKQNLYKIGYSKGSVTRRVSGAKNDPTYLMADVEIISVFRCFNMSTQKFENTIHSFFDEVRLEIEIIDQDRRKYKPREWFDVPLPIIEEAISIIINDEIKNYYYDSKIQQIIRN